MTFERPTRSAFSVEHALPRGSRMEKDRKRSKKKGIAARAGVLHSSPSFRQIREFTGEYNRRKQDRIFISLDFIGRLAPPSYEHVNVGYCLGVRKHGNNPTVRGIEILFLRPFRVSPVFRIFPRSVTPSSERGRRGRGRESAPYRRSNRASSFTADYFSAG